ncbi:FAD/NAD(P)-binding protein [Gramella lutea]|uniref:FAD/NAD(P)-binding protein n=1 Tax=Christiangramia lutea TaxID=1607951 RepID=A0A9X2AA82_9FLAO|nr:FAD/NAD(P)-binding protein [Christiangramia lutea]MCH4824155.1 FAD/NAD(P)-binding protein [Christiangramia lutea]
MHKKVIAIVGCGPRGLAALEELFKEISNFKTSIDFEVILFETSKNLGTGKAWDLDQPNSNWINISDFALQELEGRVKISFDSFSVPSFPSYRDWCLANGFQKASEKDKDVYPPRSVMGTYLNERFNSIFDILKENNLVSHYSEEIVDLQKSDNKIKLISTESSYDVDECLLTIGHQPTELSEESQTWKNHAERRKCVYIHDPYESEIADNNWDHKEIAIKGFGLSMIDICRMLTTCRGGGFREKPDSKFLKYLKTGDEVKIYPFSLDGLPVVPKPYGRKVDSYFQPSKRQVKHFELKIENHLVEPEKIENIDFLVSAFASISAEIYSEMETPYTKGNYENEEIEKLIKDWLNDMDTKHALILDTSMPTRDYMEKTVSMANGESAFSLDYTVGQIWRQLQPTMYRLFAHSGLKGEVMKEIVDLDESTKRYSYGPPVESILQLLALMDADVLDLRFIKDPETDLHEKGWKLRRENESVVANVMINSILAGPDIEKMDSTIIKKLKKNLQIEQVESGLGIATESSGLILVENYNSQIPVAVLGRNSKGSILGTDAILECFSPEIELWAQGVVERIS